jgi:hypothetical protein
MGHGDTRPEGLLGAGLMAALVAPRVKQSVEPIAYSDEDRDRFHSFTKAAGDGCRVWVGQFDREGWPVFWHDRRPRPACEVAWEMAYGKAVPAGMTAASDCDGYACVRPDHLCLEPAGKGCEQIPTPGGPLTAPEVAFLWDYVYCLGGTERDASRSLGGLHMTTVRRGLKLALEVSPDRWEARLRRPAGNEDQLSVPWD